MEENQIESIKRGVNLYSDYTIVRIENSKPLFIKDPDESIYKELTDSDIEEINVILKRLGRKVLKGNPNTEKQPKRVLRPKPKKNEKIKK